ncbi:helix-turn-helix transcriptional regulator [Runella slithyformis]|uniref:Regulatory protein LuxR n=1 Tax=Runella slithyformis (strain ATCC 29530 / DSM 19594 / LMG 11500 / NCIMB 11436 / LSU 4) TaxID=761193 RepID=A0A7U4E7T4_RUNSL|nr:LuxR C-terminal-related transcriptional regulator [Runella slithyformis]AEI50519.1 regulatory protein LuxR [Runella slithyformis DSM 19594]
MPKLTIQNLLRRIQDSPFSKDEDIFLLTTLTQGELDLLVLLIDAPSNKELATKLSIEIKSVENCKTRIGEKLNQTGQGALVPYCAQIQHFTSLQFSRFTPSILEKKTF